MSPRTDKTVVLVVVKFCESFLPFFGNHRCKERKSYTTCYDKWHMYCNLTILYGICTVMILYGACTVMILYGRGTVTILNFTSYVMILHYVSSVRILQVL